MMNPPPNTSGQGNYGYPTTQQGQPPPDYQQNNEGYRRTFTSEELKVLRECSRESMYFRSIPLAGLFSGLTFAALRKGIFKVTPRAGYATKMVCAAVAGYVVGKISYQNACAEKLMKLPDSPVGKALRKRYGRMGFEESFDREPGFNVDASSDPEPLHLSQQPIFDDHRPDLHNEGLDEYERGVTDSLNPYTELPPNASRPVTTYEELRRQNREEYVNRMAEKYRKIPTDLPGDSSLSNLPESDLSSPSPPPPPPPPPSGQRYVKKNKYGDIVYE